MDSESLTRILNDEKIGIKDIGKKYRGIEDIIKSKAYNCWKHPFIICEYSRICTIDTTFQKSIDSCMGSYFESEHFTEEERKAMVQDTDFYKWSVFGVEYFAFLLNNISHRIDDFDGKECEWFELTKHHKILPFSPKRSDTSKTLHVRPSEFSSISSTKESCRIAAILSKAEKDLLRKYGPLDGIGDFFATVGTGMHRLYNSQPDGNFIHNVTLNALGIPGMTRNNYCEVDVRGEHNGVRYGGSCDSYFHFANNLLIEDLKRFRHTVREQFGKVLQLLAYGLPSLLNDERLKNGLFVGGTIKRNVTSKSIKHRYPRTNMTLIDRRYIEDFYQRLEQKLEFQSEVDNDPEVFFKEIAKVEDLDANGVKGMEVTKDEKKFYRKVMSCSKCFSKNICLAARKAVRDKGNIQCILQPKYSLV